MKAYCMLSNVGFGVLDKLAIEFDQVFWPPKRSFFFIAPSCRDSSGLLNMWINQTVINDQPVLIGLTVGQDQCNAMCLSDDQLLDLGKYSF